MPTFEARTSNSFQTAVFEYPHDLDRSILIADVRNPTVPFFGDPDRDRHFDQNCNSPRTDIPSPTMQSTALPINSGRCSDDATVIAAKITDKKKEKTVWLHISANTFSGSASVPIHFFCHVQHPPFLCLTRIGGVFTTAFAAFSSNWE